MAFGGHKKEHCECLAPLPAPCCGCTADKDGTKCWCPQRKELQKCECGVAGSCDRFLMKCHICEELVRFHECTFRCGFPFCCACVAEWYGRDPCDKMDHPRVPPPPCNRRQENPAKHPGIPPELKDPVIINTMYFRPQWHYMPWRSSVVDIKKTRTHCTHNYGHLLPPRK